MFVTSLTNTALCVWLVQTLPDVQDGKKLQQNEFLRFQNKELGTHPPAECISATPKNCATPVTAIAVAHQLVEVEKAPSRGNLSARWMDDVSFLQCHKTANNTTGNHSRGDREGLESWKWELLWDTTTYTRNFLSRCQTLMAECLTWVVWNWGFKKYGDRQKL